MGLNANVILFLACILAGFALLKMGPLLGVLATLGIVQIIGVIAVVVFAFVILFIGVKALISGRWLS